MPWRQRRRSSWQCGGVTTSLQSWLKRKKKVGSFADNLTAAVKAEYETLKKSKNP